MVDLRADSKAPWMAESMAELKVVVKVDMLVV